MTTGAKISFMMLLILNLGRNASIMDSHSLALPLPKKSTANRGENAIKNHKYIILKIFTTSIRSIAIKKTITIPNLIIIIIRWSEMLFDVLLVYISLWILRTEDHI